MPEWRLLPPLRPTFGVRPPVVAPAASFVGQLPGARPLVRPTPSGRRPATLDSPRGKVDGLVVARTQRSVPTAPRHRPGRTRPEAQAEAADDVPEVALPPPPARRPPVRDGVPPAFELTSFTGTVAGTTTAGRGPAPAAAVALAVTEVAALDARPDPVPVPRPTLGQSRRLGLGPPFQRPMPEEATTAAPDDPAGASWDDVGEAGADGRGDVERRPHDAGDDAPPTWAAPSAGGGDDVVADWTAPTGGAGDDEGVAPPVHVAPPVDPEARAHRLDTSTQGDGPDGPPSGDGTPEAPSGADARPGLPRPPTVPAVAADAARRPPREPPGDGDAPMRLSPSPTRPPAGTEPVPGSLRTALRQAYGIDVGDLPVRRGPEARQQATVIGARAFTRAGEVFVPAEEGPLDGPPAIGILAHELTHVAQQRVLGSALPREASPEGRRLEAAAQEAERHFRGDAGIPPPSAALIHPPPPRTVDAAVSAERVADELIEQGLAHRDTSGTLVLDVPLSPSPSTAPADAGVQRLEAAAPQRPAIESFRDLGQALEADLRATLLDSWNITDVAQGHQESGAVRPGIPAGQTTSMDPAPRPAAPAEARATGAPGAHAAAEHHARRSQSSAGRAEHRARDATGQAQRAGQHAEAAQRHATAAEEHAESAASATGVSPPASGARAAPARPAHGGPAAPASAAGGAVEVHRPAITSFSALGAALASDFRAETLGSWNILEESGGDQESGQVRAGSRQPGGGAAAGPERGIRPSGAGTTGAMAAPAPDAHRGVTSAGRPQIDVDELDLEELARRLYDRLRTHLRAELLVDRERAGLLTDFR